MRRLIVAMFMALLAAGSASAQIVTALPFNLQNNTVADATQVMANFNQIVNNVNTNAAKNGSNSDITALLGLTTPLAPSVGGTTVYTGGTSGGSANAQTVTPVVPSTFTLAAGSRVVFVAGFANTGATTLNVSASGAKNVYRRTQFSPSALVGGEIKVSDIVEVIYDGVQYQLQGRVDTVGTIVDYAGGSAPAGWALADNTCVSQTGQGALLFALVGTTYGTCGAGLFALPDLRGRVTAGVDGGTGRIATVCGGLLSQACGAQNQTIAQANLPTATFSVTDTRTWATSNVLQTTGAATGFAAGANLAFAAQQPVVVTGGSISASSGGSDVALTTMQPTIILNKLIKY